MAEAHWLWVAGLASLLGMAWLALSLDTHWRQVLPSNPTRRSSRLRAAGALSLATALVFCLVADHASMAILVWVMFIAASAVSVAMTLTWKPQWLRILALPWASTAASVQL